jgi:hypothetical protein
MAAVPQCAHHGRSDQAAVTGNVDSGCMGYLHGMLLVVLVNLVALFLDQ